MEEKRMGPSAGIPAQAMSLALISSFFMASDAMRIVTFIKSLAVLTIPAMAGVFFARPEGLANTAAVFIQCEALALAGAIGFTIAHPFIFGVSKGERVLLITTDPVSNSLSIRLAVALQKGKVHENIKIGLDGGLEALATIESYPGIFTPARVSVKPENAIRVI
ncbi:Uncharacterised protein [uncultured archaeon]|nr:Uncharacterised protein [uncultured archaeon]